MVSRQRLLLNTKTELSKHPIFNSVHIKVGSLSDSNYLDASNVANKVQKSLNIQLMQARTLL